MTKEERFEKYMPQYLKHDIDEFIKNKDDSKCTVIDCLLDEIYGSINSALWDGEISEEQARVHPMKNVLIQAVGAEKNISVDVGQFRVNNGDVYLLCTDGLTNMVSDEEISKILHETKNPADDLVEAALNHGGKDNVSVIVVGIL